MAADLKLLPQGERLLSGKLSSGITAIATTMDVNNPPTASKLPTYFEIDYGTDDAEVVRVIDVSGNTLTIERGVNSGGVGVEHLVNANYKQKITNQFATLVTSAIENGWLPEDTSYAFARVTTSSFKVTASGVDRTGLYSAGRRVRLNGSVIVTISSSSYSNPDTTVSVKETTVPTPITSIELEIGAKGKFRVVATGAEVVTGTDDEKITTPKAIKDAADGLITLTDVTTNNASTSKHGFLKKLDNDVTHFMNGQGGWTVPGNSFSDAEGDPAQVGTAASDGVSSYAARRDHVHARLNSTRSIWIPASAMQKDGLTGAGTVARSSVDDIGHFFLLDRDTQEGASFNIVLPADFLSGNLSYYIYYTKSADGVGNIRFRLRNGGLADEGEQADLAAANNDFTDTPASNTAGILSIATAVSLATTNSSPGAVQSVGIYRMGADAADTYGGDIRLLGVRVDYTSVQ